VRSDIERRERGVHHTRVGLAGADLAGHDDRVEAARESGERELRALDRGRAVRHERETVVVPQLVEDRFRVGIERLGREARTLERSVELRGERRIDDAAAPQRASPPSTKPFPRPRAQGTPRPGEFPGRWHGRWLGGAWSCSSCVSTAVPTMPPQPGP